MDPEQFTKLPQSFIIPIYQFLTSCTFLLFKYRASPSRRTPLCSRPHNEASTASEKKLEFVFQMMATVQNVVGQSSRKVKGLSWFMIAIVPKAPWRYSNACLLNLRRRQSSSLRNSFAWRAATTASTVLRNQTNLICAVLSRTCDLVLRSQRP